MIKDLYERILNAKYTHIGAETASYCTQREGDRLYILFEESNGKTDWLNNFDFPAKPYRDMHNKWYAHRGFLKVWKVIEPCLASEIDNPDVKYIIIGGYSHGAAIAVLCHEYCKYNRPEILVEGYGFGCPRVVWGFIRKAVKKRFEGFTVIRNGKDIVTKVPPAILGYRHIGNMLIIGRNKGYNSIDAHRPENYIKELSDESKFKEIC